MFRNRFVALVLLLGSFVLAPSPARAASIGYAGFAGGALESWASGSADFAQLFYTYRVDANVIQSAIWGLLNDGPRNLTAIGLFGDSFLRDLYTSSHQGPSAGILWPGGRSDQALARVSEPSTLLLLGAGWLLFARRQRRRAQLLTGAVRAGSVSE